MRGMAGDTAPRPLLCSARCKSARGLGGPGRVARIASAASRCALHPLPASQRKGSRPTECSCCTGRPQMAASGTPHKPHSCCKPSLEPISGPLDMSTLKTIRPEGESGARESSCASNSRHTLSRAYPYHQTLKGSKRHIAAKPRFPTPSQLMEWQGLTLADLFFHDFWALSPPSVLGEALVRPANQPLTIIQV